MNIEQWLPVVGYEEIYEVSDCGNVRRVAPRPNGQRWTQANRTMTVDRASGYVRFGICDMQAKRTTVSVHQLVMRAFMGPIPEGMEPNHKDGNRANNRLANLEYVTHSENIRHARRVLGSKMGPVGVQCRCAKIDPDIVREIRSMRTNGEKLRVIGEKYGLTIGAVHQVCSRTTWKQVK